MSKLSLQYSKIEQMWQKKNVITLAIILSGISLTFYLFFSGSMYTERPVWCQIVGYLLEDIALVGSSLLCFRNGFSKQMPRESRIWLLIGAALVSYLIGNLFFCLWELLWHLDPVGSLSDPFYLIFYVFLCFAMIINIINKKIKLKLYQWSIVAGITTYATVMAMWVMKPPTSANLTPPPAIVSTAQSSSIPASPTPQLVAATTSGVPEWVKSMDAVFKPYGAMFNQFCVWWDVVLFGLAVAMILAFWGSRLGNAWQFNAQAMICFYISDMWLAYASNHISGYQTGFMLEVFWIFGIVQFGVAAALEFEHMVACQKVVDSNSY